MTCADPVSQYNTSHPLSQFLLEASQNKMMRIGQFLESQLSEPKMLDNLARAEIIRILKRQPFNCILTQR